MQNNQEQKEKGLFPIFLKLTKLRDYLYAFDLCEKYGMLILTTHNSPAYVLLREDIAEKYSIMQSHPKIKSNTVGFSAFLHLREVLELCNEKNVLYVKYYKKESPFILATAKTLNSICLYSLKTGDPLPILPSDIYEVSDQDPFAE